MAASSADLTAFFQDERKSIKRGENRHKSAHVELQLLEGGVSRFSESEEGKRSDITYVTGVVFIMTCFHKLMHRPFDDKQTFFT